MSAQKIANKKVQVAPDGEVSKTASRPDFEHPHPHTPRNCHKLIAESSVRRDMAGSEGRRRLLQTIRMTLLQVVQWCTSKQSSRPGENGYKLVLYVWVFWTMAFVNKNG